MKVVQLIFGMLLILCALGLGSYNYYLDYTYENKIGGYMENAYWSNTPSMMNEQLKLAKVGMINEGLEEKDYGAMFFKKPDNSMVYQYRHLDSIIERVDAVDLWLKDMQKTGSVETMNDVYEQKMDNLRTFIKEGARSDDVAKQAWYVKYHPIVYLCGIFLIFIFIISGVLLIVYGVFE